MLLGTLFQESKTNLVPNADPKELGQGAFVLYLQ